MDSFKIALTGLLVLGMVSCAPFSGETEPRQEPSPSPARSSAELEGSGEGKAVTEGVTAESAPPVVPDFDDPGAEDPELESSLPDLGQLGEAELTDLLLTSEELGLLGDVPDDYVVDYPLLSYWVRALPPITAGELGHDPCAAAVAELSAAGINPPGLHASVLNRWGREQVTLGMEAYTAPADSNVLWRQVNEACDGVEYERWNAGGPDIPLKLEAFEYEPAVGFVERSLDGSGVDSFFLSYDAGHVTVIFYLVTGDEDFVHRVVDAQTEKVSDAAS